MAELDALRTDALQAQRQAEDATRDAPEVPTDPRGRTDLLVNGADLPDTAAELAGMLATLPTLSEVLQQPETLTPEAAAATMRAEWGASYEANMRAAKAALARLPIHLRARFTEIPELGNAPPVLRLLAAVGKRTAQGGR